MTKWNKSNSTGVRYRLHDTRKHGVGFDRYFSIRYRVDGSLKEEGLGWASEGWTEKKAAAIRSELTSNQTRGEGPKTLQEKRKTKRQADQEAADRAAEAREVERLKEELLLDNIFKQYCAANTHKKSLRDEKSYYRNWIREPLGQKRLDQIVLLDLERIRKAMLEAGKAPRSIQYIKSIVRQTYNYAIERNLYNGPVPTLHFLKKQKVDNRRHRYLTPDDAEILLEKIKETSEKTYRICLLSLNTGMRFGEIASLKWQHIDTNRREIIIIDPKNAESRAVFMSDTIKTMFHDMDHGNPADLAFPSRKGGKMASVSKTFSRAVSDLGFNKGIKDRRMQVVFHTLRHSCASWLVNSGVAIPVIAKILGHRSLQMTMRYSHVNDASVQGAMKMLDQQQKKKETIVAINSKQ